MKIVLYLLLVTSLDSLAPAKKNLNPLTLNSEEKKEHVAIPIPEQNSGEGSTAPMRDQSRQRGSIAIRRFPTISFYYKLDDYKICSRDGSVIKVGTLDNAFKEDFPCQVAIRDAAYSCKKSKIGDLSKLIVESLERMKK